MKRAYEELSGNSNNVDNNYSGNNAPTTITTSTSFLMNAQSDTNHNSNNDNHHVTAMHSTATPISATPHAITVPLLHPSSLPSHHTFHGQLQPQLLQQRQQNNSFVMIGNRGFIPVNSNSAISGSSSIGDNGHGSMKIPKAIVYQYQPMAVDSPTKKFRISLNESISIYNNNNEAALDGYPSMINSPATSNLYDSEVVACTSSVASDESLDHFRLPRQNSNNTNNDRRDNRREFIEIMIWNLFPFIAESTTLFHFIVVSKHSYQALQHNHTWRAICELTFDAFQFFPPPISQRSPMYWRDVVYQNIWSISDHVNHNVSIPYEHLLHNIISPFKAQTRGLSRDQIVKDKRHQLYNWDVAGVRSVDNDRSDTVLLDWICLWTSKWRTEKDKSQFLRSVLFNQSTHPVYVLSSSVPIRHMLFHANSTVLHLVNPNKIDHQLKYFKPSFCKHVRHILGNNISLVSFEMKKYAKGQNGSGTSWCSSFKFVIMGSDNVSHWFETYFHHNTVSNVTILRVNDVPVIAQQVVMKLNMSVCQTLESIFMTQLAPDCQEVPLDLINSQSSCSSSSQQSGHWSDSQQQNSQNASRLLSIDDIILSDLYHLIPEAPRVSSFIFEILFYLISCVCINIANRYVSTVTNLSNKKDNIYSHIMEKYRIIR